MDSVVTTRECPLCGHVFARFLDHLPERREAKEQRVCPVCNKPVMVRIMRHPNERL
jgi:endogenous inhibitor of DNA gyrase (YacG/DUF329 family)